MQVVRKSSERGYADHGWLKSFHSFSFAGYYDPAHMGVGPLRVINEDRITVGSGFGTHGHKDMEIISYVLDGAVSHKDSMGNGSTIKPGDVQRMSAGTGVTHSEFNGNPSGETHFMQIWIQPAKSGGAPGYEEKHFSDAEKRGKLRLIASQDAREGSVTVAQDISMYAGFFDKQEQQTLEVDPERLTYVQVARGAIEVNGNKLEHGDAILVKDEASISISNGSNAEIIVFDLPQ
jgi:quercetin 2,3-dioxygenase